MKLNWNHTELRDVDWTELTYGSDTCWSLVLASLNHWVTSQDDNATNHFHYYKPMFLFIILLWFHHRVVRVNKIVNWLLVWILRHCWINYSPPAAGIGRFSAHNSGASQPALSDSSHLPHSQTKYSPILNFLWNSHRCDCDGCDAVIVS